VAAHSIISQWLVTANNASFPIEIGAIMNQPVNFRISGLSLEQFASFFAMDDAALSKRGARLMIADQNPGFPCRVSLEDAEVGERVLLLPHAHHDVDSPYRSSGPIFVRENALPAKLAVNELPPVMWHRLLSLRGYDSAGVMLASEVTEGKQAVVEQIRRMFTDPKIAYLHIHNAKAGCYSCRVDRAM
jgi:hypothetical protein